MNCEACGGEMERGSAEIELRSGLRVFLLGQRGWYCWPCGTARFSAEDLAVAERQLQDAAADGLGRNLELAVETDQPAKAA